MTYIFKLAIKSDRKETNYLRVSLVNWKIILSQKGMEMKFMWNKFASLTPILQLGTIWSPSEFYLDILIIWYRVLSLSYCNGQKKQIKKKSILRNIHEFHVKNSSKLCSVGHFSTIFNVLRSSENGKDFQSCWKWPGYCHDISFYFQR